MLTSGLIIFTSPSHSLHKKKYEGGGREEAAREGRAGAREPCRRGELVVPGAGPTRGSTHGWEPEGLVAGGKELMWCEPERRC